MQHTQALQHLNLLLIDDSHQSNAELYSVFSSIFKTITFAHDAANALDAYAQGTIDIIISDIQLPDIDGLTIIEEIRTSNARIPIIILSAYTNKEYLLRAANLQIDGYVTKPLNFKKLESALERAVARLEHRIQPIQIAASVTYHPLQKVLEVDGEEVSLGNKECLLLELLVHTNRRVVSKEAIHEAVWPDEIVSESALKNLLGELRKKLKYDLIKNRHGLGWYLAEER